MVGSKEILYTVAFRHNLVACDLVCSNASVAIAEFIADMRAEDRRQSILEAGRYVGISSDNLMFFPLAEHEELLMTTADSFEIVDDAIESMQRSCATIVAVVSLSDGVAVFGRRSA